MDALVSGGIHDWISALRAPVGVGVGIGTLMCP
jgi:hypothetical protein